MLENPSDAAAVKRHAPQRTRSLNRRKSGDRFERINYSHGNDGDKNQVTSSRNASALEHAEAAVSTIPNESPHPCLISVEGCCNSEAAQLLNEKKPVMYSGASGSAWGHSKLPPQIDLLAELRRAMRNSGNVGTPMNPAAHS